MIKIQGEKFMCSSKSYSSSSSTTTEELLEKTNAVLSTEKTASTVAEKTSTKRTVSSLRVPLANTTDTSTTGVNTDDTLTGLNITV